MRHSEILLQIGSKEIGTVYFRSCEQVQRGLFSNQKEIPPPPFRQSLKIVNSGLQIEFPYNLIIHIRSIS